MLELDFVKRELYSQINYGKTLEHDKQHLKSHLKKMEDEMHVTIGTYQELLGSQHVDEHADVHRLRQEVALMQRSVEDAERGRQLAVSQAVVHRDEVKGL